MDLLVSNLTLRIVKVTKSPKHIVYSYVIILFGFSSSYFTTRADGLNHLMPFFAIPIYILIIVSSLKMFPKIKITENTNSNKSVKGLPDKSATKRDVLLLLRFISALLVFVMHSRIVFGVAPKNITNSSQWLFFSPAWLGMNIFFTLSGYLMGTVFSSGKYQLSRSGYNAYYKSRFLRIYPAMFFLSFILLTFLYPVWLGNKNFILRIFTFTFNGMNGAAGFGAYWSLTTEFQFYLIVPAISFLVHHYLKTSRAKFFTIVLLFASGNLVRFISTLHYGSSLKFWNPYIYTPLYENFDLFLSGLVLAYIPKSDIRKFAYFAKQFWIWCFFILYLIYAKISWLALVDSNITSIKFFVIVLPSLASAVVLFLIVGIEESSRTWIKPSKIWWPLIRILGPFTYCIYLLHSAVLISIQQAFPNLSYLDKLFIAMPLILVLSAFTFFGVESRFHKSRK